MKKNFKCILAVILLIPCFFLFGGCLQDGKSAYEIAVDNGFVGTETDWLNSLQGEYAAQGKSAYEIAVQNGYIGSEAEWLESLKGDKGDSGEDGMDEVIARSLLSVVSVRAKFSGATSLGSGVIIELNKSSGTSYIITNYHVVYSEGISSQITVNLYGMEYTDYAIPVQYVGGSLTNDIAVLKVSNSDTLKNSNATAAKVDTSQVRTGQSVAAIGNPEGEGIAATKGIVSVDSEDLSITLADNTTTGNLRVMRIDAAVNEGNSGGGLFDANGNLIGIVNAKMESVKIDNIAYAIPSVVAYGIAGNIINQEKGGATAGNLQAKRFTLGVSLRINSSYAEYDETQKLTSIVETIKVDSVAADSPAAAAGFKAGDILVSMNVNGIEKTLDRDYLLGDYLLYFSGGDSVKITVKRGTQTITCRVVLSGNANIIN